MLLPKKSIFKKTNEYLRLDLVFSELFSNFVIFFLVAYILEEIFPGLVTFGISLKALLWVTVIVGVIYAFFENSYIVELKKETSFWKNISIKVILFVSSFSILISFILFAEIKNLTSSAVVITISTGLTIFILGLLFVGEGKSNQEVKNWFVKLIRVTSILGFCSIAIWCLISNLTPSGFIIFKINPLHLSRHVIEFANKETQVIKVSGDGKHYYRAVYQNPLLFSVQIPRLFKRADISVTYKPITSNAPVSIGVKRAKAGMEYTLAADYQPLLESMQPQWQKVEGDTYDAWVRNKAYAKALEDMEKQKKINEENLRKKFQEDTEKLNRQVQSEIITQDVYASARKELQLKLNTDVANNAVPKLPDSSSYINPYKTITDVLEKSNTPFSRIATYNTSSDELFSGESFGSFNDASAYNQETIVRGSHTFVGYIQDNRTITGTLTLIDSNKHENGDPVTVTITQNNNIVFQKKLEDDGNQSPNNKASNELSIVFKDIAVKKGIFHVSVSTNDDVFIKRIQISAPFAAFTKSLYVADSLAYENIFPGSAKTTTLFTNSTSLTFVTSHKEGFQDIGVNKRSIRLSKADEKITVDKLQGVTKIVIPKGDVKVTGDGAFSFQEKSPLLFYKNTSLSSVTTPDQLSEYDVLLASYTPSEKDGEWHIARASIDSPNLGYPDKVATIGVNFGQLGIDGRKVIIKEVSVTFIKDPITISKIISKIRGYFD